MNQNLWTYALWVIIILFVIALIVLKVGKSDNLSRAAREAAGKLGPEA